ncbi:DUF4112 domain-containing protein [Alteromonas sp. LMIT006]|uniref:DUF4112 domain-containing protein n=1 Tax=Alteromonadaceae TaxID=72275 RepID=UPI0020CA8568|nr:DUF4112 domain-containing protein [Alteromonas sp. LMIT006]UTP73437.1 DUF4112 domain-containing protein [Alteromonas sp. LMIT006]
MLAPKALTDAQDIANTLDTAVKIPFIGVRVGLDFLIGLIPGIGDAIVLLMSWRIVYLGRKMGVPKTVLTQMVRNSLLDFGLGFVPLVGDIVDIFYKANTKNVQLMERWWISNHKDDVDAYAKEQLASWEAEQARLDKAELSETQQALLKAQQEDKEL